MGETPDRPPSHWEAPATPPPPPTWAQPAPAPPGNGQAIASLCLGAGGLFMLLTGFGVLFFLNLPCSILAWVFGVIGKRRVDRGETDQHRGLAQAGLIMGIIGTVLGLVALAAWIVFIALAAGGHLDEALVRSPGM
jgi:Domain of unknown function (DUF4190)